MSHGISSNLGMDLAGKGKAAMSPIKPQADQKAAVEGKVVTKEAANGNEWENDRLKTNDVGDTAVLSSAVDVPSAVGPPASHSIFGVPLTKNLEGMIAAYKTALRGSRSHNDFYERFMRGMAANAMVCALSLFGVSSKEISSIQAGVREEALEQIEGNVVRWAHDKMMMEIVG